MSHVKLSRFRFAVVGAAVGAVLVGSPLMPAASAHPAPARVAAAAPSTFGGVTSQGLPIIVDVNGSKRQVVRVLTAVDLTCTPSGLVAVVPDGFRRLSVSKQRKFKATFGPQTQRNADGTTTDYQGSMTGRFNRAKTTATGTWRLTAVDHDATGAVTDTCASGAVTWRAKQ
jgi:hypothetical protein